MAGSSRGLSITRISEEFRGFSAVVRTRTSPESLAGSSFQWISRSNSGEICRKDCCSDRSNRLRSPFYPGSQRRSVRFPDHAHADQASQTSSRFAVRSGSLERLPASVKSRMKLDLEVLHHGLHASQAGRLRYLLQTPWWG